MMGQKSNLVEVIKNLLIIILFARLNGFMSSGNPPIFTRNVEIHVL